MSGSRWLGTIAALAAILTGCRTELPQVAPEAFACTDDRPDAHGRLPCPDTHWCSEQQCTPRLRCADPDAAQPGCKAGVERCELSVDDSLAAVRCESGIVTATSAPPRRLDDCACADGLHCTALGSTRADLGAAYPLYVLPSGPGAAAALAQAGIAAEFAPGRICARPCATELDCPASHTCRAAAVLGPAFFAAPTSGRTTVGICYPDLLTTATVALQPDPGFCRWNGDCSTPLGRPGVLCQAQVSVVPDHPRAPAGAAWGTRRAIIARCIAQLPAGLIGDGRACTHSAECSSGICRNGRCAALCDPADPNACAGLRGCTDRQVQREQADGPPLLDRAFVCDPR